MARFSEEEVEILVNLVKSEIREVERDVSAVWFDDYVPTLQILLSELQKYHNKHYPEDGDGDIF